MQAKAIIEWLGREDTDADFISKERPIKIIYDEDMRLLVREDVSATFQELLNKWIGCKISKYTLQQVGHAFTATIMQYRKEGILFLSNELMPPTSSYYTLQHTEDFDLYDEYFYYS